ncbi:MAG: hypothetical protein JWQ27_819 [Ferruginibacter sp.]|nr:hypothetical protein [Ferruginibacter sp.]
MKKLLVACCIFSLMSFSVWQPDFETAKQEASKHHRLILLNFSGSDWCGPCMRMKREIFDADIFSALADSSLAMVNADFPRSKKHQLAANVQKANDQLADKYNPEGKFPFTLLLDAEGHILKSWDGLPDADAVGFTKEVKAICDARK